MTPPSAPRATINDVAKLAGVSISTVSRVLNATAPVADETMERVQQAIRLLGFQPHPVARSLAGGKSHTIGILVPDLTNPFFSSLMGGIEEGVRNGGFDLLVHLTDSARWQNGQRVQPLGEHNTDGLLVFTHNINDAEIIRLHGLNFPLVLLFRSAPQGLPIPTVNIDNESGSRAAIDHLIDHCGRRRIAFLQGLLNNEDSYWREMGYRHSLAAHAILVDPRLIARGNFAETGCAAILENWLQPEMAVDAIFADNDLLAIDVLASLRKADVKVPEQIAVIGFDDLPIAEYVNPSLTTVRSPIRQAGNHSVRLLLQLIQQRVNESIVLPTQLVVRQSSC